MEIKDKTVLVLGGYGEVGIAVCRQILVYGPRAIIATSLREAEAAAAAEAIREECKGPCTIFAEYGNLFVRHSERNRTLDEIVKDTTLLRRFVDDNLGELTEEILTSSTLYRIVTSHNPEIIIDCVNTATALAYRDVFYAYRKMCRDDDADSFRRDPDAGYKLLSTVAIPPLIRHIQILYEAMKRAGTLVYLKVGTTGTGGMGFNIPFTHGEEIPSRLLLAKSALSGAQTMLLFTLSRTPGWPVIKEIKPAAMIGWKGIGMGRIVRSGKEINLYDCPIEKAFQLNTGTTFDVNGSGHGAALRGRTLEGVFVDTGENGVFSRDEFKVVTALGLMEFVTPEEIALTAALDILGVDCSKDVIGAIDGAVMGPTYQAGCLREAAVRRLDGMGFSGVSYGFLGPRTSKLIFEADLFRQCFDSMEDVVNLPAGQVSKVLEKEIGERDTLRIGPISIGIPILLSDGQKVLFAERKSADKNWEEKSWTVTPENINKFVSQEWIDLRPQNMSRWQDRFRKILEENCCSESCMSSRLGKGDCMERKNGKTCIDGGEIVARVLIEEFGAGRNKAYTSTGAKYI